MDIIKFGTLYFLLLLLSFPARAQDTLRLSREQSETRFLKENLLLMAESLQISQAEAVLLQAKLWPNPSLSVDEVNLWATDRQLRVFGEELQGFNGGSFGRNQQISLSIEQLVLTAGKRKKLMALEQVSVDKSRQYFEDLLRHLKMEFRGQLTNLQYLQGVRDTYHGQLKSVQQLTQAYKRQVAQGSIPRGEYIRLKALELELAKNISALNEDLNEAQKELKLLMRLPAHTHLELTDDGYTRDTQQLQALALEHLVSQAKEARPDYKLAELEQTYFDKLYTYERAQRVPDLTLSGGYDRGGNFMYNFVGFGVAMDLPFFNRNQGNIKAAKIGREQAKLLFQHKDQSIESETVLAYQNLRNALHFYSQIEPDYERSLDELLSSYTRNLTGRNISLLEYLDFMEAYLENKKIILEAGKELNDKAEELNFAIGQDIINY
ncbi:TolC family protein [Pontibacter chinhatensis]|uniref:Outer membrane protein, cobalt-zinc-cadmium efflux system n=1 Tax=Pontibacter chinhatensis TaxID=1436961 RepID=A0A1I2WPU1_9BACT|nr:TolC family protein [Pontibacter chinhatensis]SFH03400.1 outer membrane protein, cobalt-zinc-cadmium efflux system [Pontibacter chinhatensis]